MTNKQLTINSTKNKYQQMHKIYAEAKTPVSQSLSENDIFEIGKTLGGFNWVGTKNGYLAISNIESSYHYKVIRHILGINIKKLNIPYFLTRSALGHLTRSLLSPMIKEDISPTVTTNVHYLVYDRSEDGTSQYLVQAGVCSIEEFVKMLPSYKSFSENLQKAREEVLNK